MRVTDTIRLGRIGGVRVGLNWTLLAMAAFLAFALSESRLPYDAPGYPSAAYWATGAATAVALLIGVLLHELGHAVVAKRAGLRVDGITLWFMGGLTRIEGDAATPGAELRISGVGPLVSLLIGGLCWAAHFLMQQVGASPLALDAVGWLAVINIALAIFNLLPGAPLDGGRVLHSVVWAITRDRWRATRVASGAGAVLGGALVVGGVVALAYHDGIDGVMLGMLGWFMFTSARGEEQVAALQRAFDGVTVKDMMRPVRGAPGWFTVDALLSGYATIPGSVLMLEQWTGGYGGVVSVDALAAVPPAQRSMVRGIDVAVPISQTTGAALGDDALQALTADGSAKVILVVQDERTVGAVLPSDLEAWLQRGPSVAAGVH